MDGLGLVEPPLVEPQPGPTEPGGQKPSEPGHIGLQAAANAVGLEHPSKGIIESHVIRVPTIARREWTTHHYHDVTRCEAEYQGSNWAFPNRSHQTKLHRLRR